MNKDMDKKLDQLLADVPKPEYDLDAWLAEDESEEFDRLQRMNMGLHGGLSSMQRTDTDSHGSNRKVWRWVAAAACLIIIIGIGVRVKQMHHKSESKPMLAENNAQPLPSLIGENNAQPLPSSVGERPKDACEARTPPRKGRVQRGAAARPESMKKGRGAAARTVAKNTLPDTLGTGIWQRKENVVRAVQLLSDCAADIRQEEQEIRNGIVEATFRATPQPKNAILVTTEAGDYEVIETRNIIEI